MSFSIDGVDEVLRNADAIISKYVDTVESALTMGGMVIEGKAKEYCPVDTGTLRRSITTQTTTKTSKKVIVTVGTNVEYAPHQEYGTYKMAAQPYLRPAISNNKNAIITAIKRGLTL